MAIQTNSQRVRFPINVDDWSVAPTDLIAQAAILLANGADLQFENIFYHGDLGTLADSNLVDFTNIASVNYALQPNNDPHNASAYWSFSVPNANITNTMTVELWNVQPYVSTSTQITLAVPNVNNSIVAIAPSSTFWLCVYGLTTDNPAKQVPYLFCPVSVFDTGMPIVNPTIPSPLKVGSTLNFVCSDGLTRSVTVQSVGAGLWSLQPNQAGFNGPGQQFYAIYCSDGLYRNISVINVAGTWTLDINQTGHS